VILYDKLIDYGSLLECMSYLEETFKELQISGPADLRKNGLIELDSKTVFIDVIKKREKVSVVKGKKQIEIFKELYIFRRKKYWNEEILNINRSKVAEKWFEELTKENEKEYKEECKRLNNFYTLVSEKYIEEYIKNYLK